MLRSLSDLENRARISQAACVNDWGFKIVVQQPMQVNGGCRRNAPSQRFAEREPTKLDRLNRVSGTTADFGHLFLSEIQNQPQSREVMPLG